MRTGSHSSVSRRGSQKPRGITPITVRGMPSRSSVRPMIEGSAPNRARHSPSLNRTTALLPGWSSPAANVRPTAALTPSTRNRSALASAPARRAGSPVPLKLTPTRSRYAATPCSVWLRSRTPTNSASERAPQTLTSDRGSSYGSRSQGDADQDRRNDQERHRVGGCHAEQKACKHARDCHRADQPDDNADDDEPHSLAHHQPKHVGSPRAERHAHAHLVRAVRHEVSDHTGQPHRSQQERYARERAEQDRAVALGRRRLGQLTLEPEDARCTLLGIQLLELPPDRFDQPRRIDLGPNRDRRRRITGLQRGDEDFGSGGHVAGELSDVLYLSNDRPSRPRDRHAVSDRVGAAQKFTGERPVHDRNGCPVSVIQGDEVAPGSHAGSDSFEVAG